MTSVSSLCSIHHFRLFFRFLYDSCLCKAGTNDSDSARAVAFVADGSILLAGTSDVVLHPENERMRAWDIFELNTDGIFHGRLGVRRGLVLQTSIQVSLWLQASRITDEDVPIQMT